MRIYRIDEHDFTPLDPASLGDLLAARTPIWVDMTGPTADDVRIMHEVFRFHPLTIEDTRNQRQRPRIDEFSGYLFSILNAVEARDGEVAFRELDVFVGAHYLVTVHADRGAAGHLLAGQTGEPIIDAVLDRCRARVGVHIALSVEYVLYVLAAHIVESYFPILESITDEIDRLSEAVLAGTQQSQIERIFALKRSLAEIGRVSNQQRDMFAVLMRDESDYIRVKGVRYYMRDVYDHLMRITEEVNTDRETLDGLVNLYLSSFSNRLNVTVSRLTVLTIMFGAFAVITGFYGMNFEQTWPPFSAPWGVPFVIGLMLVVLVVVVLVFYPRRRR